MHASPDSPLQSVHPSRRAFLRHSAAAITAIGLPEIVPGSALGLGGATPPSGRLHLGTMGIGPRALSVLPLFLAENDARMIAVADCRAERLEAAKNLVDQHYGNRDCAAHADFRDLFARPDLDGVYIATGVRWHGLASILAMRAGKDVYAEKPIALTVAEGREVTETARRFGAVYQGGHQRRSVDSCRFVADVVRGGMIGRVRRAILRCWAGSEAGPFVQQPVPPGFDYDQWLGQCPWQPYSPQLIAGGWHRLWTTAGGVLLDMNCHWTDLLAFCLERDHSMPVEYQGEATWASSGASETPLTCDVHMRYPDGIEVLLQSQGTFQERLFRIEGDAGWIEFWDDTGTVAAEPKSILNSMRAFRTRSYTEAGGHIRDFLDSMRRRTLTIDPPETAHRATATVHIANICLRLGRPLRWDPVTERFVGDPEADRLLSQPRRAPWCA